MEIATTTRNQIIALDRGALFAWGAKDMVATNRGLQFRVGGLAKFKGLVHIKYDAGADLYDVEFLKIKKGLPVVVQTTDGIYAEDLVRAIDLVVQ